SASSGLGSWRHGRTSAPTNSQGGWKNSLMRNRSARSRCGATRGARAIVAVSTLLGHCDVTTPPHARVANPACCPAVPGAVCVWPAASRDLAIGRRQDWKRSLVRRTRSDCRHALRRVPPGTRTGRADMKRHKWSEAMNGELVIAARFADGVEVPIRLAEEEDAA